MCNPFFLTIPYTGKRVNHHVLAISCIVEENTTLGHDGLIPLRGWEEIISCAIRFFLKTQFLCDLLGN
jgi:hypothetical protein